MTFIFEKKTMVKCGNKKEKFSLLLSFNKVKGFLVPINDNEKYKFKQKTSELRK